jgi:hypothetical protein
VVEQTSVEGWNIIQKEKHEMNKKWAAKKLCWWTEHIYPSHPLIYFHPLFHVVQTIWCKITGYQLLMYNYKNFIFFLTHWLSQAFTKAWIINAIFSPLISHSLPFHLVGTIVIVLLLHNEKNFINFKMHWLAGYS